MAKLFCFNLILSKKIYIFYSQHNFCFESLLQKSFWKAYVLTVRIKNTTTFWSQKCGLIPCTRIISHFSNKIVSDNYTHFISSIDLYYNKNKSKFASSVNYENISAHRATGKHRSKRVKLGTVTIYHKSNQKRGWDPKYVY